MAQAIMKPSKASVFPQFDFAQDPLDYWQRTHHTSADTYERLDMADLTQAAVVVASTAYLIANRDSLMPRPVSRSGLHEYAGRLHRP